METEMYKMTYKTSENTKELRILGEIFVVNNENKGNIIINNKKERIKSILATNYLKENKIKMVLNKNIYNISCLFKDCELLESLESLTNKNLQSIKNTSNNEDNKYIIDNENINLIMYTNNNNFDESESSDCLSNYYTDS